MYVGIASGLIKRIWEHREGFVEGFTQEYGVKQLVWYETHNDALSAITREKQIKKWNRAWKTNLIQKENPNPYWRDWYETLST